MEAKVVLHISLLITLFAPQSSVSQESQSLEKVTPNTGYDVFKKDGTCFQGFLKRIQTGHFVFRVASGTVEAGEQAELDTLPEDLLQIREGQEIVWSRRSSWQDLRLVRLYPRESLRIALKTGQNFKAKSFTVTDNDLEIHKGPKHDKLRKSDIAKVEYIRTPPLSSDFRYLEQEAPFLTFLSPEFYSHATGLAGMLTVPVYDTARAEDKQPLDCPPKPSNESSR